ncbi:MAG: hypothetical protein A6F71_06375 [Cycloclasticus sp. symbiont of Poecilosclerida sp. M]|nr:MAG: hypothetical protein A6F71_06375 [Cycloclasticus sp. symbiont of Poecilosclerida sp. M]
MMYRITSLLMLVSLSGCVLTENTRDAAFHLPALELQGGNSTVLVVGVLDERPYVVSGKKPAKYIGEFELSMGGPYDAFTNSKQPMANEFTDKLSGLLSKKFPKIKTVHLKLGLSKQGAVDKLLESGSSKVILITLKEWKSHTAIDTSLWFDAQLETFNAKKQLLSYKRTQGHDTFGGAALAGPITNAKRTLPHAFRQKMQALFSDSLVMASLTSNSAVPIAQRAVDDVTAPMPAEGELVVRQACTVELILYWKNSGIADQEILTRCNAVK